MPEKKPESQQDSLLGSEVEANLRAAFDAMPHKVPVMLFTEKDNNDVLNQAARDLLRAFNRISNKIDLKEFDLNGAEAKKRNVNSSPALVFDPDRYSIRYLGVPFGEEGRTLVGMILLLGFQTANLSEQSRKIIGKYQLEEGNQGFRQPDLPLLSRSGDQCREGGN